MDHSADDVEHKAVSIEDKVNRAVEGGSQGRSLVAEVRRQECARSWCATILFGVAYVVDSPRGKCLNRLNPFRSFSHLSNFLRILHCC
jgi:hypothetical protein